MSDIVTRLDDWDPDEELGGTFATDLPEAARVADLDDAPER